MRQFVVWDDLYADPVMMRKYALDMQYEQQANKNYPGRNSVARSMPPEMVKFISYLVGEPLKPTATSHCGGFRYQTKDDVGNQKIHIDLPGPNTRWAGVCYLSPPELYTREDGTVLDAGTKFWKNREFGFEELPYDIEYLAKLGINGYDDLFKFMNTEGVDESKWIHTMSIPIKFNRLIMFRSNLWHSQGELFGTDINDSRLIQTFFFDIDNEQQAAQPQQVPTPNKGWKTVE